MVRNMGPLFTSRSPLLLEIIKSRPVLFAVLAGPELLARIRYLVERLARLGATPLVGVQDLTIVAPLLQALRMITVAILALQVENATFWTMCRGEML
jgi:hypothetical protein